MRIEKGLMAGQVLQRDARGQGRARIEGICPSAGDVEWRLLRTGRVVRGRDWRPAGRAEAGRFLAEIAGLSTGGPYCVELRVGDGRSAVQRLSLENVFVGDVWILAGQSNMEGVGNLDAAPRPHPRVRAFSMCDEWRLAEERLHFLAEAVDEVHNGYGCGPARPSRERLEQMRTGLVKGVGPGLAFGLEMLRRTGVPQGLIPCAHGGTSMAQWSPALRDRGGRSLYGAMMRRYGKLGQPVAGVLWYQGESDANRDAAARYTQAMVELVAATRRDMGLPRLPWLVVQLGCHAACDDDRSWNEIQEQQRRLPGLIRRLDVAPAVDLELDDGIHIAGEAQCLLGRRLARLADRLVHRNRHARPGIVVKGIRLVPVPHRVPGGNGMAVEITYGHVAGGLCSPGRPTGFALLNERGEDVRGIYRVSLARNHVLLHTQRPRQELEGLCISYGLGRQPYCNITDREGMSIPAMRAVPIA